MRYEAITDSDGDLVYKTWPDARDDAIARGGHLVTIANQEEWTVFKEYLDYAYTLPNWWVFWLGASDSTTEGQYEWVTGEPWSFTFWDYTEPTGTTDQNYVIVGNSQEGLPYYRWGDFPNDYSAPYIVEYDNGYTDPNDSDSDDDGLSDGYEVNTSATDPNDSDSDDDGLSDGYEVNTSATDPNDSDSDDDGLTDRDELISSTYSLIEGLYTWQQAKNEAISRGGHLATVTSSNEWNTIVELWETASPNIYWLGASDEEQEGVWKWITDENWTVEFWDDVNPNNGGGEEHMLTIAHLDGIPYWNDAESWGVRSFILETTNSALFVTNPNDDDSDDDGLTDYQEVITYSTDPNDDDSDNDRLTDGYEVNVSGTDPNSSNVRNEIDNNEGFVSIEPNGNFEVTGRPLGVYYDGSMTNYWHWRTATNYTTSSDDGYLILDNTDPTAHTSIYINNDVNIPSNRRLIGGRVYGDLTIYGLNTPYVSANYALIDITKAENLIINGGIYDRARKSNHPNAAVFLSNILGNTVIKNAEFYGPNEGQGWIGVPDWHGLFIVASNDILLENVTCYGGNSESVEEIIVQGQAPAANTELNGGDGLRIESNSSDVIIDGGYFKGGQPGEYDIIEIGVDGITRTRLSDYNIGYAAHIECNSLTITNDTTFSGRLFLNVNEFTISSNSTSQIDILESNTDLSIDSYTKSKIKAFMGTGTISVTDTGEQFIANDVDSDNDGVTDANEINSGTNPNNIRDPNQAPIITSTNAFTVAENTSPTLTMSATDINGDTLNYSLDGADASYFTINNQTGELEFNSPPDFELKDSYEIELVVNDVRSFVSIGDPGISPGGVYALYKFEGNGTNETDNVNDSNHPDEVSLDSAIRFDMQDFVEGVDGFAYSSQSTNYNSLTFPLYTWAYVGEKTYGFWAKDEIASDNYPSAYIHMGVGEDDRAILLNLSSDPSLGGENPPCLLFGCPVYNDYLEYPIEDVQAFTSSWKHIAVTYNPSNTTSRLYVNGVEVDNDNNVSSSDSQSLSGMLVLPNGLSNHYSNPGIDPAGYLISGLNFTIDELFFDDKELSPSVISNIGTLLADQSSLNAREVITITITDDRTEDFDGDGLTEAEEEDVYGASDLLLDSDGDGYSDIEEISLGSLPDQIADFPISGTWNQYGNIVASEIEGRTVSINSAGTRIAIASPSSSPDGHVSIYDWNGYQWVTNGFFTVPFDQNYGGFGNSLTLSGDGNYLAVGNPMHNWDGYLKIYKYEDEQWVEDFFHFRSQGAAEGNKFYGYSLSFNYDGSVLAVGEVASDYGVDIYADRVRIYRRNGSGIWNESSSSSIFAENENGTVGMAVSLSDDGNRIAVGEILNLDHSASQPRDIGFDAQCVVNVYEWNGGDWIKLGQQLESSYPINQLQHSILFVNRSISLSGDGTRLGVANYDSYWWGPDNRPEILTPGSVSVYEYDNTSWNIVGSEIEGRTGQHLFGKDIDLNYDGSVIAIIGDQSVERSVHSRDNEVDIFYLNGNTWSPIGSTLDYIGATSVSLSSNGTTVVVGYPFLQYSTSVWGLAKVYQLPYADLTVSTSGSGTVSVESGTFTAGTNLNISVTPSEGYLFTGWSGDITNSYASSNIVLQLYNNMNITAVFSEDADNDGLTNNEEVLLGTNPRSADSDGDDLNDEYEINTSLTDPNDPDSDNDGLTDYDEIITYTTKPNQTDSDNDGLSDYDEVITYETDPLTDADKDNDDFTDSDEVNEYGTDPSDPSSYPVWNVNISVNGDGDITPLSGTYKRGTNITFTATEGTGYLFTGWYGDLLLDPVNMSLSTNILISTNLNIVVAFSDDADGDGLTNTEENTLGSNPWLLDSDGDGIDDPTEVGMTNMVFTFNPTLNSQDEIDRFRDMLENIPGMNENSMMDLRGGDIELSINDNIATIRIPLQASTDGGNNWIDTTNVIETTYSATNSSGFFEMEFE